MRVLEEEVAIHGPLPEIFMLLGMRHISERYTRAAQSVALGALGCSVEVLSNTGKTNIRDHESMQGQAARMCSGLPRCQLMTATVAIARNHHITTYITTDFLRVHIEHVSRVETTISNGFLVSMLFDDRRLEHQGHWLNL